LSTLRFAFGWYDIPQKQLQLQHVLLSMLQQMGLDEQAYQYDRLQPQQRGRERWQLRRHRIAVPPSLSLTAFEERLQERLPDLSHKIMARRSREHDHHTSVAFTLGVANVPTDICIFTQIRPVSPPSVAALPSTPEPLVKSEPPPAPTAAPRIAIVIDDMGWELPIAQDLFALDQPLSFAVLPQAPYQFEIAEAAKQYKRDLLLHLPMEPHGYPQVNPGPNALLNMMDPNQMVTLVRDALKSLPQVVGVNNHMGSSLTESPQAMRVVMRELKRHDLFFLDSRTSVDSQAYQIAREMGIPTAKRHLFLDNDVQQAHIATQLHRLAKMASQQGYAIGIGHPYPETLHALQHTLPIIHQAGVLIVPISRLVN
jgi:polysaccharide deacetylase 2 family uncharacterized protein YibQ